MTVLRRSRAPHASSPATPRATPAWVGHGCLAAVLGLTPRVGYHRRLDRRPASPRAPESFPYVKTSRSIQRKLAQSVFRFFSGLRFPEEETYVHGSERPAQPSILLPSNAAGWPARLARPAARSAFFSRSFFSLFLRVSNFGRPQLLSRSSVFGDSNF